MSRLDPVSRLIANAVLETTIDQLAIVGGTLPAPPSASGGDDGATVAAATESVGHVNTTSKALVDILPLERKQIQQNSSTSSSAADELNGEKVASLRRLAIETSYVQRVLEDTLDEINEDGTYASLAESVAKSRERDREKKKISESERAMRKEISDLKSSIAEATRRAEEDVREVNLEIGRLKDSLLESRRAARGEEDFVRALEAVRERERMKAQDGEEARLVTRRDGLRRDLEHEQRVTLEIESWLNDRRTQLRELHRFWTEKLKTDVAQKDQELQELLASREADQKRKEDAMERLAEAKEFVRTETERREKKRRAAERASLEFRTCLRIQSWWRMTLVRKGLGVYNKKGKGGKSAGKDGGGGKDGGAGSKSKANGKK